MLGLKPWVYKSILDIIDLSPKLALEKGVNVRSIQISQELYLMIYKYLRENYLITHTRHGAGGRFGGGNYYTYSYKFKLTHSREKDKYFINDGGAVGHQSENSFFKNPYKADMKELERLTPTILQLFYGILKKYPMHLLNVEWDYQEEVKTPWENRFK
ncbi:hypothetical protein [Acinetobacter ursingii]|uniref:hypothetical protein n=1 Tax=Acinetobacter ursingii TaxID=108980 RepID=UPI00125011B7|nr:hypothetical protein [Acinetobacter ursingii]